MSAAPCAAQMTLAAAARVAMGGTLMETMCRIYLFAQKLLHVEFNMKI